MAMIGYLAHHTVNDEAAIAILLAAHERQHLGHKKPLLLRGLSAMRTQHRHRRVARIALEDREFERVFELTVPLGVPFQFAEVTLRHLETLVPAVLLIELRAFASAREPVDARGRSP
jgi:hypothetical protein